MSDPSEGECKYCGGVLQLAKAVHFNPETEEFEYACVNCALASEKKLVKHSRRHT